MDLDHYLDRRDWSTPPSIVEPWAMPADEPCWPRFDLFPRLSRLFAFWSDRRG